MNHTTQQQHTQRYAHRYHAEPAFDQVLSIFVEQGHAQLVPSFLAYELDLTTEAAERLLDDMVKHSLLELDFDDNGNLHYSLNPDVLFELEQHARHQAPVDRADGGYASSASRPPMVDDWPLSNASPGNQTDPQGFDGTVGQGAPAHNLPTSDPMRHDRAQPPSVGPDGCDGTVGHPGERAPSADLLRGRRRAYQESNARHPSRRDSAQHGNGVDGGLPYTGEQAPGSQAAPGSASGELVRHTRSDLSTRRRNAEPMVAALLSVLLVGTGQIYNRDVGKGVAFFVVYAILLTTFFPVGWMINVWAAVDAYYSAQRRNAETT